MEGNGLRGGIFSNLSPGILGLEMPIQQQQQQQPPPPPQQQRPQNPHHFHPQMVAFARPEPDHSSQMKQPGYPYDANPRQLSDDEEGGTEENAADGKRKGSPWQRMKWTDGMVRLLIMAVYYIGDECGSEAGGGEAAAGKKKAGALMQKKGKWKSVSRAMMEKGFYVSPQQCEDKFNDLNKRYKRVNEILGKGTACRVVENQSLLDQMDHLTPKSKEEARKLLNSKHLFFREMCAYHNSCGGGAGHHSPEQALVPRNSSETLQIHHNNHSEDEGDEEDSENEEDDDSQNEEEEEVRRSTKGRIEGDAGMMQTRRRTSFVGLRGLEGEVAAVMSDGGRSGWEKREWLKRRMVKVEEERVGQEMEAFEIEKERLKWVKYSGKKEREMVRKRLRNERAKLENDRMVLLLKHEELEMMSHFSQQQMQMQMQSCNNKRADPSSVTG